MLDSIVRGQFCYGSAARAVLRLGQFCFGSAALAVWRVSGHSAEMAARFARCVPWRRRLVCAHVQLRVHGHAARRLLRSFGTMQANWSAAPDERFAAPDEHGFLLRRLRWCSPRGQQISATAPDFPHSESGVHALALEQRYVRPGSLDFRLQAFRTRVGEKTSKR